MSFQAKAVAPGAKPRYTGRSGFFIICKIKYYMKLFSGSISELDACSIILYGAFNCIVFIISIILTLSHSSD